MEYVGFRIWYGDGSVKSNLDGPWNELPSQDVQFVTFYEMRTYPIWIEDKWVTENYVVQFYSQDYYWLDSSGEPGAGSAAEAIDVPDGYLKTGSWMLEETGVAFWNLAAEAQMVRIAP
jgi:hypothetical protein